jgi:hypothetical protein
MKGGCAYEADLFRNIYRNSLSDWRIVVPEFHFRTGSCRTTGDERENQDHIRGVASAIPFVRKIYTLLYERKVLLWQNESAIQYVYSVGTTNGGNMSLGNPRTRLE